MKYLVKFLLREIIRPVVEQVVAEKMRRPDDRGSVKKAIKRGLSLYPSGKPDSRIYQKPQPATRCRRRTSCRTCSIPAARRPANSSCSRLTS